jgi:prepilin-type N-terminal cleavage/methylation domain-containing protein
MLSMWAIRDKCSKYSGFTIVELVIVIAIIGILATVTVVAYNGVQDSAKLSRAYTIIKNYQSALKLVALNEGLPIDVNACLGPTSAYPPNPANPGNAACGQGGQYANSLPSLNSQLSSRGMTDQPILPFTGQLQHILYNVSYYGNYYNIIYTLPGEMVDCGVQPVISPNGTGGWGAVGAKYTISNAGSGNTFCIVGINP